MIHGHIHNFRNQNSGWSTIKGNKSILNAGVDINGFRPVTLWELEDNNNAFKSLKEEPKKFPKKGLRKNLDKLFS